MSTIKNRLKALRNKEGLTQEQLVEKLNSNLVDGERPISKMTVSSWENNKHSIKQDKAQALSDFFGVSVGYLLGYEDELITFSSGAEFEKYRKKLLETIEPKIETAKQLYELISDEDFQDNLKAQQEAYIFLEEYFDNSAKWDNFVKNVVHHPSYLVYLQGLVEYDKEDGTNDGDLLINYLLLDETDKKIAFDLIEKLADRDRN